MMPDEVDRQSTSLSASCMLQIPQSLDKQGHSPFLEIDLISVLPHLNPACDLSSRQLFLSCVAQDESAAASILYLDVATLAKHTTATSKNTDTDCKKATGNSADPPSAGNALSIGIREVGYRGPTMIMSDAENYTQGDRRKKNPRKKAKKGECCIVG